MYSNNSRIIKYFWDIVVKSNTMYYNDYMKNMSILNDKIDNYNIEELSSHVQELYDIGKMSSTQYDDLMSYLQDLQ